MSIDKSLEIVNLSSLESLNVEVMANVENNVEAIGEKQTSLVGVELDNREEVTKELDAMEGFRSNQEGSGGQMEVSTQPLHIVIEKRGLIY